MANLEPLLDFIGRAENGGKVDYNVIYGGIRRDDRPEVPITTMTVGEVLAWQDRIDHKYMSEAAGKYQILEDTLRGLYRTAGVPLTARFDKAAQDALGVALLRRRGLDDFLAGRIGAEKFADNLSKEWASLPCHIKDRQGRAAQGQSYYAGDGLNKSHVTRAAVLDVLGQIVGAPEPDPREHLWESKTVGVSVGGFGGVVGWLSENWHTLETWEKLTALAVAAAFAFVIYDRRKKWGRGVR